MFVFSDSLQQLARLSTEAGELSRSLRSGLVAVTPGEGNSEEERRWLSRLGYDAVLRLKGFPGAPFRPDIYSAALVRVVEKFGPAAVVFDSSKTGVEVCARVAQRLRLPAATGCTRAWLDGSSLLVERPYYGGRFTAVQRLERKPFLVSLTPRGAPPVPEGERDLEARDFEVLVEAPRVKLEAVRLRQGGGELEKAERVVAVGRGLKRREDLEIVRALAGVLGAELAGTRPITEDLKWLPHEAQVGISGKTIKPKLYIACGVSGQIQHVAGMRNAKLVVAINTDKDAPIFQEADYGIVGDLYEVVPALTRALSERVKKN